MVLEAPVVGSCAAPKPHSDAAGQDALHGASVEGGEDEWWFITITLLLLMWI